MEVEKQVGANDGSNHRASHGKTKFSGCQQAMSLGKGKNNKLKTEGKAEAGVSNLRPSRANSFEFSGCQQATSLSQGEKTRRSQKAKKRQELTILTVCPFSCVPPSILLSPCSVLLSFLCLSLREQMTLTLQDRRRTRCTKQE